MDRSTLLPLFCRAFTAPAWEPGGLRVVFLSMLFIEVPCRPGKSRADRKCERAVGFRDDARSTTRMRARAKIFPAVYNRDGFSRYMSGCVSTQNSHFTRPFYPPAQGNPPPRAANRAILRFINADEHKIMLSVIPRSGKVSLKGPALVQKAFQHQGCSYIQMAEA